MPERKDYEEALEKLTELKEVTDRINSARVTEALAKTQQLIEEELKEAVYQDYKATRE